MRGWIIGIGMGLVLASSVPAVACDRWCQEEMQLEREDARLAERRQRRVDESYRRSDALMRPTTLERMVVREMPGTTYRHPRPRTRVRDHGNSGWR